jgi:hypothetical protein
MLELNKFLTGGENPGPCRKGEVKEVKITGDTATAKYEVKDPDGSATTQDLKLKRIDGSWRLNDLLMLSAMDNGAPADASTKPAKP